MKGKWQRVECVRLLVFGCLSAATSGRPLGQSGDDELRNENRRAITATSATGVSFYDTTMTSPTKFAMTETPTYTPNGMLPLESEQWLKVTVAMTTTMSTSVAGKAGSDNKVVTSEPSCKVHWEIRWKTDTQMASSTSFSIVAFATLPPTVEADTNVGNNDECCSNDSTCCWIQTTSRTLISPYLYLSDNFFVERARMYNSESETCLILFLSWRFQGSVVIIIIIPRVNWGLRQLFNEILLRSAPDILRRSNF